MTDTTTERPSPADLAKLLQNRGREDENIDDEGTETESEGREPTSIDELPKFWQEKIRKLRGENQNLRRRAKDATPAAPQADDLQAAEAKGRTAAREEYGTKLAGAEIRARLAGLELPKDSIDGLISKLNLTNYVDDGEVNIDEVDSLVEEIVKLRGNTRRTAKVDHGRSGEAPKNATDEFKKWIQGS